MTKHVADRRSPSDGSRTAAFAAIARRTGEEGSHPATRAAVRRATEAATPARTRAFLRIARGREA